MKRCRQSYRCRVGTTASQCRIIVVFADPLETCHNYYFSLFQFMTDTILIDLDQLRISRHRCRVHCHLKSIQRDGRHTQGMHRHRHKCHGGLFSCGKQHIQLTLRRVGIDIIRHFQQHIRLLSHSRKDYNYVMSFFIILYTTVCHIKNPLFISNRSTTKFLYDQHVLFSSCHFETDPNNSFIS